MCSNLGKSTLDVDPKIAKNICGFRILLAQLVLSRVTKQLGNKKLDEKAKKIFQIQCQGYRNDPRQIRYNFDFFVRELQTFSIFDELSTEMKN